MGSFLLAASMLTASQPLTERERAEAFLRARHPRLGEVAPVRRLPAGLVEEILRLAQPEKLNIVLENGLESEIQVRIRKVIPRESNPRLWPEQWAGKLDSGIMVPLRGEWSPSVRVTLPIADLRMGILRTPFPVHYIYLTQGDLRNLSDSGANRLVIRFFDPYSRVDKPPYYCLEGWMPDPARPGRFKQVWTKRGTPTRQ